MPYYHATFRDRLPSILKHGLGWHGATKNWAETETGVYLAEDPVHAVFMVVDFWMSNPECVESPQNFVESMAVIVIDDSRVPRHLLGPDPSVAMDGVWLYRGIIDVTNMPVVNVLDMVPPESRVFDPVATAAWVREVWGLS